MTSTPTIPTIEEKILEEFDEAWSDAGELYPNRKARVKEVLLSALTQQREHIAGEVEKMKKKKETYLGGSGTHVRAPSHVETFESGYNRAIEETLTLLQTPPRSKETN